MNVVLIFAIFCSTVSLAFAVGPNLYSGSQLDVNFQTCSPEFRYCLAMQSDGNLVVYRQSDKVPIWSSRTAGTGANKAAMQADGQFCLYTEDGRLVWSTYTRDAGSVLKLQDDGNLVVYNLLDTAVWTSKDNYKTTI